VKTFKMKGLASSVQCRAKGGSPHHMSVEAQRGDGGRIPYYSQPGAGREWVVSTKL
jgi:hypothetical protein